MGYHLTTTDDAAIAACVSVREPNHQNGIAISGSQAIMAIMISAEDITTIRHLAEKYSLKKVLLFGSAARQDGGYRDIDLAVEGIRPQDFFRLYGELMSRLSVPVDLLDLARPGLFTRMVAKEGIPLYG